MKNLTLLVICIFLFSVTIRAQEFSETIKPSLEKLVLKGDLHPSDISWEVSKNHISSISNTHHIYFTQTFNGIQVNGTASSVHILDSGEIFENNNFIKNTEIKHKGSSSPTISALKAIQLISDYLGYKISEPLRILSEEKNKNKKTLVSKGGISEKDILIKLVYNLNKENDLVLAWEVYILEIGYMHSWDVVIDASSGKIIDILDLVVYCNFENEDELNIENFLNHTEKSTVKNISGDCQNCYEVFAMPIESPYYGERSIVINPSNNIASPYGWHDVNGIQGAEFKETKGNNIDAYIGTSGESGYQPYGGELLDFTGYPFDQDFSEEERFEDASITNLFYWGNITHDILYQYGFNEGAGNFQHNNYGNGGNGDDPIIIKGQIDLNFCNAYFTPFHDGQSSFINLNVCGDKDGAFDNLVFVHEYTHGLTKRILGMGSGCNENETPWEGWSDWYGLMLTMNPNDLSTNPRGIANYLLDQGEDSYGVRPYPYSTDMEINPQTYNYIKNYDSSHDVGSVWAAILWDLTWVLIDEYGYDPDMYNFKGDINLDAGNIIALAIVTEGLSLGDCSSGFIDYRDAIINAFNTIYKGESDCILWEAFSKRGLGIHAFQGSSDDVTDGIESFNGPPFSAEFIFQLENVCVDNGIISGLSGGIPTGGVYSGEGVIDDGNGVSFSFDPAIAGIGVHAINYETFDDDCQEASIDEGSIDVVIDDLAPVANCPDDIFIIISSDSDQYSISNYSALLDYNDNCNINNVTITQSPEYETLVGVGSHIINFEVKDTAGNIANCSFNLIVEKFVEEIENTFHIYPNPTRNDLIMESTVQLGLLSSEVFDINGKLIIEKEFNEFGFEKRINLKELANGIYFLKISTVDFNIVKRIIKE